MPVPTQLSDLSATAASNSPAGGDTVGTTMDDYIRAIQSIIARISAGTDALATPNIGAATGTSLVLSGLATVNGAFTSRGIDDNATAVALTLSGSGANSITIANSATNPTIGTSTGSIDFNPVGQGVSLRVSTGGASTVNFLQVAGGVTSSRITILANGSDTNVGASWQTKGTGTHLFVTESGASAQVEILHTASANRYITLTGSNGGNPTIGTSAGNLAVSSTIVGAGDLQARAATATPAGGMAALYMGTNGYSIGFGSGAPTYTASKGSLYLRSDGSSTSTRMYVATDSAGAWTAVTTAT